MITSHRRRCFRTVYLALSLLPTALAACSSDIATVSLPSTSTFPPTSSDPKTVAALDMLASSDLSPPDMTDMIPAPDLTPDPCTGTLQASETLVSVGSQVTLTWSTQGSCSGTFTVAGMQVAGS